MNRLNRDGFDMTMRHARRASSPHRLRRGTGAAALIAIASLAGSAAAGWIPGFPPGLRLGGGSTGTQAPSHPALLQRILQSVRALAIVDQFPPSVVILFESYFTEWYLDVAVNDRNSSFEAFLVTKGVKDPGEQAMHMVLYEVVMRLLVCVPR